MLLTIYTKYLRKILHNPLQIWIEKGRLLIMLLEGFYIIFGKHFFFCFFGNQIGYKEEISFLWLLTNLLNLFNWVLILLVYWLKVIDWDVVYFSYHLHFYFITVIILLVWIWVIHPPSTQYKLHLTSYTQKLYRLPEIQYNHLTQSIR
jgi:hypothetical protein